MQSTTKLSPRTLNHGPQLAQTIDAVLTRARAGARHRKRILGFEDTLRKTASSMAWEAYLLLESAVNERNETALRAVTAWAFEQGRRERRRAKTSARRLR